MVRRSARPLARASPSSTSASSRRAWFNTFPQLSFTWIPAQSRASSAQRWLAAVILEARTTADSMV